MPLLRSGSRADHGKGGDVEVERLLVDQRPVALDDARLLERAHAAEARRRRDADAAGELDIGHAPVVLKLLQDLPVDGVEIGFHVASGPLR